jgi:WhiB family transcriptional regulator, redox-sensing transcriptional regulator
LLHVADLLGVHAAALAEQSWRQRAACRGVPVETFFPERGASLEPALRYCRPCPVRAECLAYARRAGGDKVLQGVWGGVSTRGRRPGYRRRLRAAEDLERIDDS